jgi:hypothetical protein
MASGQIVKSISLTPHTAMIVDNVLPSGKFSAFVRECLEQYYHQISPENGSCRFNSETKHTDKCNPAGKGIKCFYCWPHGSPSNEDWRLYSKRSTKWEHNPHYNNNEWIIERSRANNPVQIDFSNYEELLIEQAKKKQPRSKQVGLIRRFARWIY